MAVSPALLFTAGGLILQGISGQRQAQFQADIASSNARAAKQQASASAVRLERERRQRQGAARAALGAQGTTFEGSPIEFLADEAAEVAEEVALVRFGGQVEAREQRLRGAVFQSRARSSLLGGILGATGAVVEEINSPNFGGF